MAPRTRASTARPSVDTTTNGEPPGRGNFISKPDEAEHSKKEELPTSPESEKRLLRLPSEVRYLIYGFIMASFWTTIFPNTHRRVVQIRKQRVKRRRDANEVERRYQTFEANREKTHALAGLMAACKRKLCPAFSRKFLTT